MHRHATGRIHELRMAEQPSDMVISCDINSRGQDKAHRIGEKLSGDTGGVMKVSLE